MQLLFSAQWNAWQQLARKERERLGSVEAALRQHSAEILEQQAANSNWIEAVDPQTGSVYE